MSFEDIEVACLLALQTSSGKDKGGKREEKMRGTSGQKGWPGTSEEVTFKQRTEKRGDGPCELEENHHRGPTESCGTKWFVKDRAPSQP